MDGGMLSQDEINALLSGMDLSDDGNPGGIGSNEEVTEVPSSEPAKKAAPIKIDESMLSEVERDAIGEVANISMGSSATTLYSLVNRKVNITTPNVSLATWNNLLDEYEKPCVFIQIKYTVGLDGTNILVLKENDVKIITDLMMGGDGTNTNVELGELQLSAISEAMNQMMGSAATSLSTMLKTTIDISPPDSSRLDLTEVTDGADVAPFLGGIFVKISFRMQIDNLVDSNIMQLYPIELAHTLVDTFITSKGDEEKKEEKEKAMKKKHLYPLKELKAVGLDSSETDELSPSEEEDLGDKAARYEEERYLPNEQRAKCLGKKQKKVGSGNHVVS